MDGSDVRMDFECESCSRVFSVVWYSCNENEEPDMCPFCGSDELREPQQFHVE